MRTALGIIAGIVVAMLTIGLIEWIGHLVFPISADAALRDPESRGPAAGAIPLPALIVVVFAWFAGAFAGALVATALARRPWAGWAVAVAICLAAVVTVLMIAHPVWVQISAVIAPLLGGLVAGHRGLRQRSDRRIRGSA